MTANVKTPRACGYRLPAEWELHAATWLAWPKNKETWPGKFEKIPTHFEKLIRLLSQFEPVHVLAGGRQVMAEAQNSVGRLEQVTLHEIVTDDAWVRDFGPMFLLGPVGQPPAIVDWKYNAWGEKYPPFHHDVEATRRIAEVTGLRRFEPGCVLEGGSIDGNGRGTILTTESCLLNPNRNPGLSKIEIEWLLEEYCGAKKILWLRGGIAGDDTDGHIDQLARFVNPTTVVAAIEKDPGDENYRPLQENLARLKTMSDQDGRKLQMVELPLPQPLYYQETRLPASYCNFYIANSLVIVPQFGARADTVALEILEQLFPDRKVVGLEAEDLVWGLGAFHCLTQQQPQTGVSGEGLAKKSF